MRITELKAAETAYDTLQFASYVPIGIILRRSTITVHYRILSLNPIPTVSGTACSRVPYGFMVACNFHSNRKPTRVGVGVSWSTGLISVILKFPLHGRIIMIKPLEIFDGGILRARISCMLIQDNRLSSITLYHFYNFFTIINLFKAATSSSLPRRSKQFISASP